MNTITEKKEEIFDRDFPNLCYFVKKEIQMLKFSADLALCYCDEKSCKDLNEEAKKLSTALNTLTDRYTMDLFE